MSTSVQQHDPLSSDPTSLEPKPDDGLPATTAAHERRSAIVQTLVWIAVFASLYCGFAWWRTGAANLVVPYLQGERLLFDPLHVKIDDAPANTVVERTVRVVNCTGNDVTLIGAQPSCGCITLDEFPVVIPSGDDRTIGLRFGVPQATGLFEHSIKLFSDYENIRPYVVTVSGTVN